MRKGIAARLAVSLEVSRLFQYNWYLRRNPDVAVAGKNPRTHYVRNGWREERDPHPLFDTAWYLDKHRHEMRPDEDPLTHFCARGWKAGYDPHAHFSTSWYLSEYPDVARKGINPLLHFTRYGWKEGRRAHAAHDVSAYLNEQAKAGFGQKRKRNLMAMLAFSKRYRPNLRLLRRDFDAEGYFASNPDVGAFGRTPRAVALMHWLFIGFKAGRSAPGLKPFESRRANFASLGSKKKGVEYFGFLDEPTGMGAAARASINALKSAGVPVSAISVTPDFHIPELLGEPEMAARIFHLNADHTLRFFLGEGDRYLDNGFNIGLWVWELPSFRPEWAQSYGAFDEIWTPSEFCREAIDAISPIPVVTMPHPVSVDRAKAVYQRDYFGIPAGAFVFASIFDIGSFIERKNPLAVIEAFKKNFGTRKDVVLVLKYYDSSADQKKKKAKRILDASAGQDNIIHVSHILNDEELISLKTAVDCYVSAHRAEGFGLNIAEAMMLGQPVIATGYSGNMDYMTPENSYPVAYELTELTESYGPYYKNNLWAEPSLGDLAAKMAYVVANPVEARKKGAQAAADMAAKYSLQAVGKAMYERLSKIGILDGSVRQREEGEKKRHYSWRHGLSLISSADRKLVASLPSTPTISLLVPVYNVDGPFLEACIRSVQKQSYPYWELILQDDRTTRAETLAALDRYKATDPRIKVIYSSENRGIAGATNAAVHATTGEYVAMLDNDDEISRDALFEIVKAINANPGVEFLYCDEDKLDELGRHCDTYYKPDWSPEHLETCMYVLHMLVVKRSLFLRAGGMRKEFDGAQDYDFALRLGRMTDNIVHIPKILYHWRKIPGSAAAVVDAKPWALNAGQRALQDYADSSGREGKVVEGKLPGLHRIRWSISPATVPTLLIFTANRSKDVQGRGKINLFDHFLSSILDKTTYPYGYKIVAVDNGELSSEQRKRVEATGGKVVSFDLGDRPFNFSQKANFALKHVETELVVLLNDDMEVISPEWLEALIEIAQLPTTGAVGAKLYYPDRRIQHCGMIFGIHESVAHIYHGAPADQIGYNGFTHVIRNFLSVTGACLATRMSVVREVGGFDENLALDYNDVDFCLKMHAAGYRNVFTPFAELYHFENTTIERRVQDKKERDLFFERWKQYANSDPFYNPNLPRNRVDYGV